MFRGEATTIVSIGDRESVEVLDKAKRHAAVLERLGSHMSRVVKSNANEISFASGGRILALPSSAGRGLTGNLVLDEFAYQQFAEKVWDNAAAIATLKGRIRVVSTPNGAGNKFYTLWKLANRSDSGWSCHSVSIDDAIAAGYPVDLDRCRRLANNDDRLFEQIYRCSFLDNEFQYIPGALIESAKTDSTWIEQGECFAGLDIGRTNDLTSLVIVKKDRDGVLWRQAVETKSRTQFEDLEELARDAFRTPFHCRKLCVDATGLGAFPAEQLQKRFGRVRVEPVVFTTASKEALATTLYQAFADKRIRLLHDDRQLCEDLASIRRTVTAAGHVRYDAPHTKDGHADRAWALALAVHGCNMPGGRKTILHDYDDTDYDE